MRPRKLNIVVSLQGFTMPIGTVRVQKFADVLEADSELRCPTCNELPKYTGEYTCVCGSRFNHWSRLVRVLKATGEKIVKTKFTGDGEAVNANAYVMESADFAKYSDATLEEYGITTSDEKSAANLKKLLIATKALSKVILITFNDTYEMRIGILTTSISGRILLKEIIPLNLANIKETMTVNLSSITERELEEAKTFVKMLPNATEEMLTVSDYRICGLGTHVVSAKVLDLQEILVQAQKKL